MGIKAFLQGFENKKSVNTSEGLNISLKGKRKLLPTSDVSEVISQYDVYKEEREKCNKIRLTCQVNTICSNVLFNPITEIVENEGSSGLSFLNYGIISGDTAQTNVTRDGNLFYKDNNVNFWLRSGGVVEAIRDTQLTNCGYVYHCGRDIFNNHLIRSKTFKAVCQINSTHEDYFNTIKDWLRNETGDTVDDMVYFPLSSGLAEQHQNPKQLHLYKYDDIYTYKECIENRLIKTFEGWVGFYNRSKIKTYDNYGKGANRHEKELPINKPLMYLNGGDFVDMYPDRSLYSFVPKYNTHKNRVEKNWNYCLTYPSSSTTKGFEDIIETNNNSLKAIYFNENTIADNGTRQLVIYSIAKHGLSIGDTVNVYNTTNTVDSSGRVISTTELVLNDAKVTAIADDYIFTVFSTVQLSKYWVEVTDDDYNTGITLNLNGTNTTFKTYNKEYFNNTNTDDKNKYYVIDGTDYVNFDKDAQNISYKKTVNGIECDYYVRIFSKIPNFKFASADTSNEYEIYKNDGELIKEYQKKKYDFESHVSRLAFAKNSYSDNIGEVVFTDDIDISNLKDNLGRPLTSIYLTIVKNNAGYKEWYGFDIHKGDSLDGNEYHWDKTEIKRDNVEFSHCFGAVTCGIQTSEESEYENNIKSINKINRSGEGAPLGFDVDLINDDRDTYDFYDDQYGGDIEHSKMYDINPTEVWFNLDRHYYGDLCYYDNYNAIERTIQPILHRFNTAQRESHYSESKGYFNIIYYDEIKHDDYDYEEFNIEEKQIGDNDNGVNKKNEGYYYNPHYEIKIKTFDRLETAMPDFLTLTKINPFNESVKLTCLENHNLSIGDKSMIYDKVDNKYYNCETISALTDDYKVYTCKMYKENGDLVSPVDVFNGKTIHDFNVFKLDNLGMASYASVLKDGTCRVIWRNVLNNGFSISDDSVEEYPFTNGAFYINKSINLYLKRQDPYGIWGLYSKDDISGAEVNTEDEDNYVENENIEC